MHTTTTPATSSAVVTPAIDELEQASFYSSAGVGIAGVGVQAQQQQQFVPTLESIIDAILPSFYSTQGYGIGQHNHAALQSIASLASAAAVAADISARRTAGGFNALPQEQRQLTADQCARTAGGSNAAVPQEFSAQRQQHQLAAQLLYLGNDHREPDVMEAAEILCRFKSNCGADARRMGILDLAVDMLSSSSSNRDRRRGDEKKEMMSMQREYDGDEEESIDEEDDDDDASEEENGSIVNDSLVHPDRLATDDDGDEVNKVRKTMLLHLN